MADLSEILTGPVKIINEDTIEVGGWKIYGMKLEPIPGFPEGVRVEKNKWEMVSVTIFNDFLKKKMA